MGLSKLVKPRIQEAYRINRNSRAHPEGLTEQLRM